MDRGAWQATVYEVARVQHNSVTKQQAPDSNLPSEKFTDSTVIFLATLLRENEGNRIK